MRANLRVHHRMASQLARGVHWTSRVRRAEKSSRPRLHAGSCWNFPVPETESQTQRRCKVCCSEWVGKQTFRARWWSTYKSSLIFPRFPRHVSPAYTMTIRTITLSSLKKVKNSVIGNPSAKLQYAQDEVFIQTYVTGVFCIPDLGADASTRRLVECLNHPPPISDPQGSGDDIRVEAAHVISSITYGTFAFRPYKLTTDNCM